MILTFVEYSWGYRIELDGEKVTSGYEIDYYLLDFFKDNNNNKVKIEYKQEGLE